MSFDEFKHDSLILRSALNFYELPLFFHFILGIRLQLSQRILLP